MLLFFSTILSYILCFGRPFVFGCYYSTTIKITFTLILFPWVWGL